MAIDSSWAVQQAVYAALRADATLKTLTGADPARIHDDVPQNLWPQAGQTTEALMFPNYVVIGDTSLEPGEAEAKTEDAAEERLMLHFWSRRDGYSELKQMMQAAVNALDRASLSVTGFTLVGIRFLTSRVMRDPDGETRHGVQTYRVITTESS